MQLPEITHLQFVVLGTLLDGPQTGRDVRARLQEFGVRKSGPAFYQLMARLEDGGLVQGQYEQEVVDGQRIKQRRYKVRAAGRRAWQASRDFYVTSIQGFEGPSDLANA